MLQLTLSGPGPGITLFPVTSEATLSQPRAASVTEHAAILADLAAKSDLVLQKAIHNGFVPLSILASSPKIAMID